MFIYTWLGIGATASMIISDASNAGGTLFTVAVCYGLGITIATLVAGPNSGGHLHPGFTIAFAIFKGFPWWKVPFYVFAQLLGGFVSGLLVYAQYSHQLSALKGAMIASGHGADIFSARGPPGVMAIFPPPGIPLGIIFLNEIFGSAVLGAIVFSILDPANPFVGAGSGPFVIGATMFAAICGYSANGVAFNTARDLGPRFAAAVIWGKGVMPPRFTAEACLTNILGTSLGALFQILWLSDTARPVTKDNVEMQESIACQHEAVADRNKGGEACSVCQAAQQAGGACDVCRQANAAAACTHAAKLAHTHSNGNAAGGVSTVRDPLADYSEKSSV